MQYGAHLPLIELDSGRQTLAQLRAYTRAAAALGFRFLCSNDHLLFARPWLDGPTALAATIADSADMTIATSISLPVLRGPIPTAKTLAALDVLSDGRLVAGVGPGSSPRDYAAMGLAFEERWRRFDEAVQVLRAVFRPESPGFSGSFYSTAGVSLAPAPVRPDGIPIWIASWGSPAGLRRVARLGDGWLASGYNTTPARFREGLAHFPDGFPNALATVWLFVTDKRGEADRMLSEMLAPMLGRSVDSLRALALPIGTAEECAEHVSAWVEAGVQRLFVWPLRDELRQLELFAGSVVPAVSPG